MLRPLLGSLTNCCFRRGRPHTPGHPSNEAVKIPPARAIYFGWGLSRLCNKSFSARNTRKIPPPPCFPRKKKNREACGNTAAKRRVPSRKKKGLLLLTYQSKREAANSSKFGFEKRNKRELSWERKMKSSFCIFLCVC